MRTTILFCLSLLAGTLSGADFVITISCDGMGSSYMQSMMDAGKMPNLQKFASEAAGTTNARADYDITVTLPNHVSMVTSRPILGKQGHNWKSNTDPKKGQTLHPANGITVSSVFDVAHDNGKRTGMWATKSKFSLFKVSYDAEHGAPDTTGPDNGRTKLDQFVYETASSNVTARFISDMTSHPCNYAFVHFGEADGVGHESGWGSDAYFNALMNLDACIGRIMNMVKTDPLLKNKTAVIVTADHGGELKQHAHPNNPLNYTIPFFVWGAGVTKGDLYRMNKATRSCPGYSRPGYAAKPQPIRNSDAGNLALSLLGLGPIPGSVVNAKQDLRY